MSHGEQEHPRVCGENLSTGFGKKGESGTSPRMRGKPANNNHVPTNLRNIPAYAGKTLVALVWPHLLKEHPRVCGENFLGDTQPHLNEGTSPRMRGKLGTIKQGKGVGRNIPAYAGKTPSTATPPPNWQEHPRVCGEN